MTLVSLCKHPTGPRRAVRAAHKPLAPSRSTTRTHKTLAQLTHPNPKHRHDGAARALTAALVRRRLFAVPRARSAAVHPPFRTSTRRLSVFPAPPPAPFSLPSSLSRTHAHTHTHTHTQGSRRYAPMVPTAQSSASEEGKQVRRGTVQGS